jgi:tetratricopeptide (TPR) repeat protein
MPTTRTIRWSIAAGLVLVLVVAWHWLPGGYGMLATVILCVFIGVMIAPDIAWLGAHLFIGGITGENVKFERPPQVYGPARTLAVEERWGEAIEEYRRVLRLHPGDVEAQRAIAEITLEKLGDLERGMEEYNALLSLKLDDATRVTILMRLAELYEHRYDHADYAADCLRDIIARFPDTKYAAAAGERLIQLSARHPNAAPGANTPA